jgi:hypothetical protein
LRDKLGYLFVELAERRRRCTDATQLLLSRPVSSSPARHVLVELVDEFPMNHLGQHKLNRARCGQIKKPLQFGRGSRCRQVTEQLIGVDDNEHARRLVPRRPDRSPRTNNVAPRRPGASARSAQR